MSSASQLRKSKLIHLSKKLSLFLRHKLDEIPGGFDSAGYVKVQDLLSMQPFKQDQLDTVISIVQEDQKTRFDLITKDDGQLYIRANQGHSSNSRIMEKLSEDDIYEPIVKPIDYCVHGTTEDALTKILASGGLHKMNRTHIHFAQSDDAVSGYRKSSKVKIHIDMKAAMNDGIKFYLSKNGVILSDGVNGFMHKKYFRLIENV
jgi:2'-phosphotransferase